MPYMSSVRPGEDYYKLMATQVAPATARVQAAAAPARARAQTTMGLSATQQRLIGIGAGAAPAGLIPGVTPTPGGNGDILGLLGLGGLAAGANALGLPAWATALLGVTGAALGGTGIATAFGMKFPWETPAGEGFIAPWTGETQVAPGVWGRTGVDYPGILEGFIPGQVAPYGKSIIVKVWNTNPEAPQYGQAFAMDADGYIYTQKKNGVVKRWKPPKHLVIPTNVNKLPVGRLVQAERKINGLIRKVARRSPSLKLAK